MAKRQTLQIGDDRLKARNSRVSRANRDHMQQVVKDLVDTMRENQLIGIAAPQIGENFRVFVTEPRVTKFRTLDQADELRVYCNPKIVWFSKEAVELFEGCGSVLNGTLFGPVVRPKSLEIEYEDLEGEIHWLRCDGVLARVIQHESDHLDGIEFLEKIADQKRLMAYEWYCKKVKTDPKYNNAAKITQKESGMGRKKQ